MDRCTAKLLVMILLLVVAVSLGLIYIAWDALAGMWFIPFLIGG